jgi:hypothetical protein
VFLKPRLVAVAFLLPAHRQAFATLAGCRAEPSFGKKSQTFSGYRVK